MLKKSITYTNPFSDEEVTEDHYFHLSQADIVELQVEYKAGWIETMQRFIADDDKKSMLEAMKNVILKSYGKRSLDGRAFIKNDAVREEFLGTEAYSALVMELLTNTDSIIEFFNGIVPTGVGDPKMRNLMAVPDEEKRVVTLAELEKMSTDELAKVSADISLGKAVLAPSEPEQKDESEEPRKVWPNELEDMTTEAMDQLRDDVAEGKAILMPAVPETTSGPDTPVA